MVWRGVRPIPVYEFTLIQLASKTCAVLIAVDEGDDLHFDARTGALYERTQASSTPELLKDSGRLRDLFARREKGRDLHEEMAQIACRRTCSD